MQKLQSSCYTTCIISVQIISLAIVTTVVTRSVLNEKRRKKWITKVQAENPDKDLSFLLLDYVWGAVHGAEQHSQCNLLCFSFFLFTFGDKCFKGPIYIVQDSLCEGFLTICP